MALNMTELLNEMVDRGASDLHIHTDSPPQLRIYSRLNPFKPTKSSPDETKALIYSILSPEEIKEFESRKELDKSFGIEGTSRFRMNVYYQRSTVCASIRAIPYGIPSFDELGLPEEQLIRICRSQKGLVLVTGATGSGKTTTLASVIDRINSERDCHVVTVEDPIEYVHTNKKALISQREVGSDTHSFNDALKYVMRQDPDVILIGEMRDLETIQAALNIAETGHLVFATLHTSDSVQSVNRIIDVFPSFTQAQVRTQLSFVLLATLTQQLIPLSDRPGRCLAAEIMVANFAVRAMIREEKVHQIFSLIQTGLKEGMKTMNQSLYELYRDGHLTYKDAAARVTDPEDFKRFFKGSGKGVGGIKK